MRSFGTIDAFLQHLATLPAAVAAAERHGMEAAGASLVTGAQGMIGEEIAQWAALAASTVEEKSRLGYTGRVSATDPLYRTGELRLSIKFSVAPGTLTLGTNDPIAAFQEFGTARIPPRPFIGATMFRDGRAAADLVAGYMVAAFGVNPPTRPPSNGRLTSG